MRKLLFVANVAIAIALAALLGASWWVFVRALPQTSGVIRAGVSAPVTVERDSLGEPHISAQNDSDAWFVQGYTVAEDRMWQMDMLRRLASGEVSEVVGSIAVETDRDARRLRMRRIAEDIYVKLPAAERAVLAAYTRGVNAFIESHHSRFGLEFTLLDYEPRLWSGVDTLLCGLQMYRTLTTDWKTKLVKEKMLRGGDPAKVNWLFPVRSGQEFLPGGDVQPGSNAWAVAGSRTANGKPLLSNDMHLEFSLPGIWHLTHLKTPDMDVAGVELPGVPGIIVGHNGHIAWGVTNLGFDVQELYLERMDMRTGQYLFHGALEQARPEHEIILVKGAQAEQMGTWITRHGPVFQTENGRVLTLKWSAADATQFHNIFPDVNRARNWSEFTAALARFGGPAQNFVYADDGGNIGYHVAGRLPIRRNFGGDVPADGSSGENEWDGYIPFEQLPQSFNPKDGLIVTANQNPFPRDYPYRVTGIFAPQYRSRQIRDLLSGSHAKLTPADTLRVQKDVYSGFDRFIGKQLTAAADAKHSTNEKIAAALPLLRSWDGQMDYEHAQPLITQLAFQYIRKAVAEKASPGNGGAYDVQISSAVIERLLRERPADWFPDYNAMLLDSFTKAMDEGERMQGGDPARWKWGKYMYIDLQQPVGSHLPLVGSWFNIGPLPMSGSSTTVKQTTRKLGPSERMNVSAGNWDESLMNLPVGESGSRASFHYADQWDAYYNGTSFPMRFGRIEAKSTVTFQPN